MPQSIQPQTSFLILQRADNGGWCVYGGVSEQTASEALEAPPFAGIADDEGLLEWFAEQLALPAPELQARPPNPGPVTEAAGASAPAVDGGDQLTAAELDDARTVHAVREALKPFVATAIALRWGKDDAYFSIHNVGDGYTRTALGDLRALVRAAGLWTDEMQAPSVPPDPREPDAKPAEGAEPPPAERAAEDEPGDEPDHDGADASCDGDPLRGQRMDSADIGEDEIA